MSLLPNIIKQQQCKDVPQLAVGAAELASRAQRASKRSAPVVDPAWAKEQQEAILKEAMEQAQNIMENARSFTMNSMREAAAQMNEEAARIRLLSYESGYESGFSQGLQEGRAKGEKEGLEQGRLDGYREGQSLAEKELQQKEEQLQEYFQELILDVQHQKETIIQRFETDIERLSVEIAKKILMREINENGIGSIVTAALESYKNQEWAKIAVSPQMAQMLLNDSVLQEKLQAISQNIKIVADETMDDTDCIIDLPDRMMDAGVETQMQEICSELKL